MEIDTKKNKELFISICKENIKRPGIEKLLEHLEWTDFFIAPCSTKFHMSVRGGLCQHSLNVYKTLIDLCTQLGLEIIPRLETLTIISLFHDLCKEGMYKEEMKPVKVGSQWTQEKVYVVKDDFPIGHGEKSVIKLMKFMTLTNDEIMAIRYHMGAWDASVKGGDYSINAAQDMCKYITLLHCADSLSAQILERK